MYICCSMYVHKFKTTKQKFKTMKTFMLILGGFLSFIIGLAIVAIIVGFPIMWLWNWLMPEIFGLITIGFWQAVGLFVLGGLLFKSVSTSNN